MPVYVDPVRAVIAWVNAQTSLVGAGNPLPLGASSERLRSPGQGAYAYLTWIGATRDTSEAPITTPILSASVYGMDEPNARAAAVAYANLLDSADGDPVLIGGAILLCVDQVNGPTWIPDGGEPRYLVDALISFTPA